MSEKSKYLRKDVKQQTEVKLVTVAELADWLGLSVTYIHKLANNGILEAAQHRPLKYDLKTSIHSYTKMLAMSARMHKDPDLSNKQDDARRKLKADADLKEYKAKMAELELNELEGKLHKSEDVEAVTNDLVYAVRSALIALPGRLAIDVAHIENPDEASQRIRKECFAVLSELSSYKYDPAVYEKRVRDRAGWDNSMRESGDEEE